MYYKIRKSQSTKIFLHALPLKAESALQLNSFDKNNFTSIEPIFKHWRKNNYNACQSTQYNQKVLRPRSAPKLSLSEFTFTSVSTLKLSLKSSSLS